MDIFNPTSGEILKIPDVDLSGYVPINDLSSVLSIDSNARILYSNDGNQNIDYSQPGTLSIYNNTGGTATLYFPGIGSGFYIEGNAGTGTVGVGNVNDFFFNSTVSFYNNVVGTNSTWTGNISVDNSILFGTDGGGGYYYYIANGQLSDPNGMSVDFSTRTLSRTSTILSFDYQNGKAYASDGTTEAFDYNTAGEVRFGANALRTTGGLVAFDSVFSGQDYLFQPINLTGYTDEPVYASTIGGQYGGIICNKLYLHDNIATIGEIRFELGEFYFSEDCFFAQSVIFGGTLQAGTTTFTGSVNLRTGSATANTYPLKFTSGALLATPVVGVEEFLTDKRYTTITTGAARKEFTLNDIVLTSGRVPFATTNGRLTDDADMTFATDTLTVTKVVGSTSLKSVLVESTGTVRLKGFTVATLPAGVVGDTAYVTDALAPAFLGALVGGGAITTTVFHNGTAWIVA